MISICYFRFDQYKRIDNFLKDSEVNVRFYTALLGETDFEEEDYLLIFKYAYWLYVQVSACEHPEFHANKYYEFIDGELIIEKMGRDEYLRYWCMQLGLQYIIAQNTNKKNFSYFIPRWKKIIDNTQYEPADINLTDIDHLTIYYNLDFSGFDVLSTVEVDCGIYDEYSENLAEEEKNFLLPLYKEDWARLSADVEASDNFVREMREKAAMLEEYDPCEQSEREPSKDTIQEEAKCENSATTEVAVVDKAPLDMAEKNITVQCGKYHIAQNKVTDFIKVMDILYERNFFVKKDGSIATNKQDLLDELTDKKHNLSKLLNAALQRDNYMEVFQDILDHAAEKCASS